jgi:putative DNA primase/helicase
MTYAEQASIRALTEQARARRDAEQRDRHAAAAERATAMLRYSTPADPAHPYLVAKGIRPHGGRQMGVSLLIPISIGGTLSSTQTIGPDGAKRFLPGGRIGGGYHVIDDATARPELLFCEGFATGATLHERTGAAVYCAFSANNLTAVARDVRHLHPAAQIIVCGDDDQFTKGNPGRTAAAAAALAVGAKLVMPVWRGLDLTSRPTDFNDLYRLRDAAAAVDRAIAQMRGEVARG